MKQFSFLLIDLV